jgi:hypothetical protein
LVIALLPVSGLIGFFADRNDAPALRRAWAGAWKALRERLNGR